MCTPCKYYRIHVREGEGEEESNAWFSLSFFLSVSFPFVCRQEIN
jgi:hypothetical protein